MTNRSPAAALTRLRSLAEARLRDRRPPSIRLPLRRVSQTGPSSIDTVENVRHTVQPFSEMPGPKGLPLFGTMFQFPRDTTKQTAFLQKRCQDYFPIYRESAGIIEMVVLYDVNDIERVFRAESKYPLRFDMKSWMQYRQQSGESDGVLTCNGELWFRMRRVIDKPMLKIKEVSVFTDSVHEVVADFITRLDLIKNNDGLVPDLERELFNWSLESNMLYVKDCAGTRAVPSTCQLFISGTPFCGGGWTAIGKILYERRFGGLSEDRDPELLKFIRAVRSMLSTTSLLMVLPLWISKIVNRTVYKTHMESWETLFTFGKKCVDQKMNEIAENVDTGGDEPMGILSYLYAQKSLSVPEIYSNVTELMTGAVDTTSTAMLWMLQEVSQSPRVQQKLLDEIEENLPKDTPPSYKDLQNLRYTKAVIKETLRMYPVAIGVNRIIEKDIELSGYNIPAKTAIVIYEHVLNRLPCYYDEPNVFKPERWLRGTGDKIHPFSQLAFGYGTRMCVGRRVAELEMNILLTSLIRKYTIEPGFTEPAKESMELVLKPDRPIKIKLKERK